MKIGDRVFVQDPWNGALIPYVGRVIEIVSDTTVRVCIDTKSGLTSDTVHRMAQHTGWSVYNFPVHVKYCTVMHHQGGDNAT